MFEDFSSAKISSVTSEMHGMNSERCLKWRGGGCH